MRPDHGAPIVACAHGPIARGELVELLPDHPLPDQAIRALVADTRLLAPLIQEFLDGVADGLPRALDGYSSGPLMPTSQSVATGEPRNKSAR